MFKDVVEELLEEALAKKPSLFLIEFYVSDSNAIRVVLDGDNGVNLKDCMDVSRAIEHNLDREEQDFALEVTSAGATSPLVNPRQYVKNLGRVLEVQTAEGKFEGQLAHVDGTLIRLEWKAREPKPVGKGKHTVLKQKEIEMADIEEAKVVIKF